MVYSTFKPEAGKKNSEFGKTWTIKLMKNVFLSVPYDDALLLCGGLRLSEGSVGYGIHMSVTEDDTNNQC